MDENLLLFLWKLGQFKALRRRTWIKFHDSVYLQCRKLQTKRRKKSFPAAAKRHKCIAARIEGISWQAPLQRNADETKPKCSLIVAVLVALAARNFSSNKIGYNHTSALGDSVRTSSCAKIGHIELTPLWYTMVQSTFVNTSQICSAFQRSWLAQTGAHILFQHLYHTIIKGNRQIKDPALKQSNFIPIAYLNTLALLYFRIERAEIIF